MTAIDVWIADLRATKQSQFSQPLESPVDDAIAALQQIAAGLSPAGPEAANTFFAGPAAGVPALPTFRALVNADFPAALSPSITGLTLSGNLTLSALTAGSVPFIGAAGLVKQDNANFQFDDTHFELFIGSAVVGDWSVLPGTAFFQNFTVAGGVVVGNYAVAQLGTGTTLVNAPTGSTVNLRINNTDVVAVAGGLVTVQQPLLHNASVEIAAGFVLNWNADVGISRTAAATLAIGNGAAADITGTLKLTNINFATAGQLMSTSVALTNNAAANVATITNAPTAGNPTKWVPVNDNGTIRNVPAW